MDNERMVKMKYDSGVEGGWGRGNLTKVWKDGEKEAVNKRGWTLERARVTVSVTREWRGLLNGA